MSGWLITARSIDGHSWTVGLLFTAGTLFSPGKGFISLFAVLPGCSERGIREFREFFFMRGRCENLSSKRILKLARVCLLIYGFTHRKPVLKLVFLIKKRTRDVDLSDDLRVYYTNCRSISNKIGLL